MLQGVHDLSNMRLIIDGNYFGEKIALLGHTQRVRTQNLKVRYYRHSAPRVEKTFLGKSWEIVFIM